MRHLKSFSIFESTGVLTPEQEKFLNEWTSGTWVLNPEGLVDVEGDFICRMEKLQDLKNIKFGRVSGHFQCSNNFLEALVGIPKEVGGYFDCSDNLLKTLEGAPEVVGGNFYCSENFLKTLEGAPEVVGGNFYCSLNSLRTLEGAPEVIGGEFHSDFIEIPKGKWSLATLAKLYAETDEGKKSSLVPLVSPEALQKRIDENPEKAIVDLKSIVGLPEYQDLKWPKDLESEIDLLSSLDGVGL